jgi:hypothetical protein
MSHSNNMLIEDINFSKKGNKLVLSASVQFRGQMPEIMYFATDVENSHYIAADASPFLAAVLLPCMKTGEDIFVRGVVSQKLLDNTKKIMALVSNWNIGLQKTNIYVQFIQTEKVKTLGKHEGRTRSASFFSAGVDSFYTYLKHKGDISDFILVHGFDVPLANKAFFKEVKATVKKIATKQQVHPIFIETNLADIIERKLVWDFAHGGALAAVGLFLRKGIQTVYIAGAVKKNELFPYGTHPQLDKLWSTETTRFIHDGNEHNRLGKITSVIAKSEIALENVRVCTQNFKGKYNCSQCFKCLSTMIMLTCAGAQHDAKTFIWPIDLERIKNMYYDYSLSYNIQGESSLRVLRKQHSEPALQEAIAYSLEKSKHPKLKRVITKYVAHLDQTYLDRKIYQFIFKMNKNEDRSSLFKLVYKLGVLK